MGLTAGIVGLPNVGKSTLFNAITGANVLSANYLFATIEPNVGIVEIKDPRLDALAALYHPRSIVYTSFSFTDIAGLVRGAGKGEGLGNRFLAHIRECDAICHVVRCFDDGNIIHVNGKVDPIEDIETVNLELAFADLEVLTKRIGKIEKKAQLKTDRESVVEYRLLSQAKELLNNEGSLRNLVLNKEEEELIRGYHFLTIKPVIYVMNVGEEDLAEDNDYVRKVRKYALHAKAKCVKISALAEALIEAEPNGEDKKAFLADLGIHETGLAQLARETYDALGLATFFTAGEKECRAWTFKKGMKAPACAGIVHSDFEKGFIRAEIVGYEDFLKFGSVEEAKKAGRMRSEGKDYVFRDGDIALFRFSK